VAEPQVRRGHVVGVGPGDPEQVTFEAVAALRSCACLVVSDKSATAGGTGMPDPLVAARGRLLERHLDVVPPVVRVVDPPRERRPEATATTGGYLAAVEDWHEARAAAYEEALVGHDGDAGFLVWGDPAFYDSTIRVLERVRRRGRVDLDVRVVPGVSSVQLLAARHRIVLHEVGEPLHVTTGRRLAEAVAAGQDNVVVMLNRTIAITGAGSDRLDLSDWSIWWGANLGTASEELVSGRVGDVVDAIEAARVRAREAAGWVMDVFLVRRPSEADA